MKIYCDTMVLPFMQKKQLEELIIKGNSLLFTNTAIDCRILQDNYNWTKAMLKAGTIRVEMWNTLDEMVRKPFYWSSVNVLTPEVERFLDILQYLPRKRRFARLASLINKYGLPKGIWTQGEWLPPARMSRSDANKLELDNKTATRTEIFKVAREKKLMDVLTRYNVRYCKGLALQHMCDAILSPNGSFVTIPQK